jgi:hypothetical protein
VCHPYWKPLSEPPKSGKTENVYCWSHLKTDSYQKWLDSAYCYLLNTEQRFKFALLINLSSHKHDVKKYFPFKGISIDALLRAKRLCNN